jgi:MFS family permease
MDTKEAVIDSGHIEDSRQTAVVRDAEVTTPPDYPELPWGQYLKKRWRLILRMSIIYLAVLNVGFDLSVTNTTLGMPSFRRYFGHEKDGEYVIASVYQSAWAGGTQGGQVVTDLIGGWLADRYGRKFTLTLSVAVVIIASTVQVTAHSIAAIIAGKTVSPSCRPLPKSRNWTGTRLKRDAGIWYGSWALHFIRHVLYR